MACADSEAPAADENEEPPLVLPIHFQDLDVHRVHTYMITSMGTEEAWERARYFEFDFVVDLADGEFRRSHEWDRYDGRARVAWTQDGTETVVVLDDMDPPSGRAWRDGQEVASGPAADSLLQRAYGAHINDSYWLVMPYKWKDPGVNARWLRRETSEDGRRYEVIELTFDGVGITPDNKYHAWVNRDTWLMDQWAHYSTADAEPTVTEWTNYRDVGPLILSLDKGRIHFENVRVLQGDVPTGAFSAPQ